MDNSPTHFYRYRSLSAGAAEHVERTICHSELYFPQPSSFNDPFDCHPSFLFEGTEEEWRSYNDRLNKMLQISREQWCREEKSIHSDRNRNLCNSEALSEKVSIQFFEEITEKIGVLCLSCVNNNILMWSHYADSHGGICLEFDGHFKFFARTQDVKYLPERPIINPVCQNAHEMLEATLLTKADDWKYEQEWRILEFQNGPGIYRFPAEALTGVILGAKISPQNEEKVLRWIAERTHKIKLYRSFLCGTSFSLNIEEVRPVTPSNHEQR